MYCARATSTSALLEHCLRLSYNQYINNLFSRRLSFSDTTLYIQESLQGAEGPRSAMITKIPEPTESDSLTVPADIAVFPHQH